MVASKFRPYRYCCDSLSRFPEGASMIRVYGQGTDTIKVEGNRCPTHKRFKTYQCAGMVVAFSDGTLLEVQLIDPGMWEIHVIHEGTAKITRRMNLSRGEDCTDEVTLDGDIKWAVCGEEYQLLVGQRGCRDSCKPSLVAKGAVNG